jgi:hypothetical protein
MSPSGPSGHSFLEFLSRPNRPHPLFRDFVVAAARTYIEGDKRPLPFGEFVKNGNGNGEEVLQVVGVK